MTTKVAIILMPGFAMTSFSLALDALHSANYVSNQVIFDCSVYSGSSDPSERVILSANNVSVLTNAHFSEIENIELICLCAYLNVSVYEDEKLFKCLKHQIARGGQVAALSSASFLLARSGLLKNSTCTITEEHQATFKELYPAITLQENLYTVSPNIFTCKGGTTALDMMLYIIGSYYGSELMQKVSTMQFQADKIRTLEEINKSNRYLALRLKSPLLGAAIEVMDKNTEEPYSIDLLCKKVGCSIKTLETVFKKYLAVTPSRHYLNIRLDKAYKLIKETTMPLSEIANACGFSSHSYMGQCFKNKYGFFPSYLRQSH
ncbi:GlxA family transcriptional regulator [Marinomonas fungiae]|uniref:GlxA family transcriptional regulator n=1 Tax=Marinomonas fungiae TaxID=1137284 RepID=UPI003A9269ED